MKALFFSLLLIVGIFASVHITEARTETGRTTWTNPTTNKTYIKVSYDDNYFALVDDGVLWNTAYLYNSEGQEVASKSNTSLEYAIKFVKESDSDGLIYRGEEIKSGSPLWGTTKNVVDILTTPTPTLVGQIFDGPNSFEQNSKTQTPLTSGVNSQLSQPPIQTPTNIQVLDQIVSPGTFGSGQPLHTILNQLFYVGLVAAVILAIVMIIRGGLEYMTIDAITSKENGKNRVKAALGGLLLAFSAILILNTINPGLTKLSIVFPALQQLSQVGVGGVTSGVRDDFNYESINSAITPTSEGYKTTPGRVAIDTDGTERPPFNDPDWQGQTSLQGLNANQDNYVVVPIGSTIPLGTKVQMYNSDTGITAWGIVGDRGPSPNGFGEISLHAAQELGAWTPGMGNSAKQHNITYTYYTNEKK